MELVREWALMLGGMFSWGEAWLAAAAGVFALWFGWSVRLQAKTHGESAAEDLLVGTTRGIHGSLEAFGFGISFGGVFLLPLVAKLFLAVVPAN